MTHNFLRGLGKFFDSIVFSHCRRFMYAPNNYFHPITAAAQFHQPISQLIMQTDGLMPTDEHLTFLNEQMLLNDAKTLE